jgi:hypothetical protein
MIIKLLTIVCDEVKNFCPALLSSGTAAMREDSNTAGQENLIVGYLPDKRTNKLLS